ncbi:FtsW/RodA/SpoVE family cell cycle protein [Simkania sp.]|uniref:FtsW/RodA/SpoVE family cell cycle protein n=1 Tax=Simkania sp. TaxID=34094 RepID=UPI003B51B3EF
MWNHQYLRRLDFRTFPLLLGLMIASLLVISATSITDTHGAEIGFFTPLVKSQLQWFGMGTVAYVFFAGLDYHKLREWAWIFYFATIVMLLGLFFTDSIKNVHRWYRIPIIGIGVQPSECAKLSLILTLSWFLERKGRAVGDWSTFFQASVIAFIPFALILKQPDLGSALVLYPITLGMFYFGGVNKKVVMILASLGLVVIFITALIFLGVISHEEMRPFVTHFLKDYQYERLNPATYHHQAAQTAIALGKYTGSGFRESVFTGHGFLPAASTDSVFPAFTEEFGLFGAFLILLLFFGLIYCSFQVTAVARDHFGRVLSAGVTIYLAIHVVVNIGMMCGFLPITGVPLLLMTYGGSSVLWTMIALGILQSVYTRRYMF